MWASVLITHWSSGAGGGALWSAYCNSQLLTLRVQCSDWHMRRAHAFSCKDVEGTMADALQCEHVRAKFQVKTPWPQNEQQSHNGTDMNNTLQCSIKEL